MKLPFNPQTLECYQLLQKRPYNNPFCSRTQSRMLYMFSYVFSSTFLLWSTSSVFTCFHLFCFFYDGFEECWPVTLYYDPCFGFVRCFFMIRLRLWIFDRNTREVMCSLYHIRKHMVNFDVTDHF